MVTELWVWYDTSVGDVPAEVKVLEVGGLYDADFVNFYGWGETHGGPLGIRMPRHTWGNNGFTSPATVRGMFYRPNVPSQVTVEMCLKLFDHPGVVEVEVKTVGFLGDGQVRKMQLSQTSGYEKRKGVRR